jgi:hypothetical protein
MATITKSIGTTSRDYSTITTWEAALGGAAGGSGNHAVGECYDDSDFGNGSADEAITIDEPDLLSVTLTVESNSRHTGTANTGMRIIITSDDQDCITVTIENCYIRWLEIDYQGNETASTAIYLNQSSVGVQTVEIGQCLIHDVAQAASSNAWSSAVRTGSDAGGSLIHNSILYDLAHAKGSRDVYGVWNATTRVVDMYNLTVDNLYHSGATDGEVRGILYYDDADFDLKNCVVTSCTNASVLTAVCFSPSTTVNLDGATNASDDSTAPDAIAAEPVDRAVEYVSTTDGSENYHLDTGAECIDAGTDLGAGVFDTDVDGRDRDTEGDDWDVGADEYVAGVGFAGANRILGGGVLV